MSLNNNLTELKEISLHLRKKIIETSHKAKFLIWSCLSCIDILVFSYWENLNRIETVDHIERDRFVLSKGHGPSTIPSIAHKGFFPKSDLEQFGKMGVFHEHPQTRIN